MEITAAHFFGFLAISFGLYAIYQKRITVSFGESEDSPTTVCTGRKAQIIGVITLILGLMILNSVSFSSHVLFTL